MRLETQRLVLRKPTIRDASDFAKNGNEKTMPYFTWYIPYPLTISKAKKVINWLNKEARAKKDGEKMFCFCIVLKENKEVIGIIDIYDISTKNKRAKIGYWIGKKHRGKGIASEAARAVLDLAFKKLKLNKVSADTVEDNYDSNKLLLKLGFRKIGVKKKDKMLNNKLRDIILWEKLNRI